MLGLVLQQVGHHLGLHLTLALRLYAETSLGPIDALAHVHAATVASTEELPPELLLGVAFVESRFDPRWVSRVEGTRRVYSRIRGVTPPRRFDRRKSLYCGVMQTHARTWDACLAQRDLIVAYRAGAAELTSWLEDRRVRGDLTRALAGYGCGNSGVRTGKCNRYPGRVLYQAKRLSGTTQVQARTRS